MKSVVKLRRRLVWATVARHRRCISILYHTLAWLDRPATPSAHVALSGAGGRVIITKLIFQVTIWGHDRLVGEMPFLSDNLCLCGGVCIEGAV